MVAALLLAAATTRFLIVHASPTYGSSTPPNNGGNNGGGYGSGGGYGGDVKLLEDIHTISRHWGQLSPYHENPDNRFGVKDVGVPDGCQIVQAHTLQRHAERFPTGYWDDGGNTARFAEKVANFTRDHPSQRFTGSLDFLNHYEYLMTKDLLTGMGANTEFQLGVNFWNKYGRILYDAQKGQVHYEPKNAKGELEKRPVLRTTSQARIENSEINWSLGFFGPSYQGVADPNLKAVASDADRVYDLVVIPEGGTENNTLASYDSCFRSVDNDYTGQLGDLDLLTYLPYLKASTARIQKSAPKGFEFTNNDTYAMQTICAYENAYIGMSDFCNFWTADEWAGFEQTLDIEYYYDYTWGNPTGRAQGLGYLQELLARLKHEYIFVSNSSVNSTITQDEKNFPLDRPFYADFSHDDILISVLTAMSVDYFKDAPDLKKFPPNPKRHFILADLTPFGANLVTEVIACNDANPKANPRTRTHYKSGQNGYDKTKATNKFVRMRLNNGIVPLASIRGGKCAHRTDGLCAMKAFFESQEKAEELANYVNSCFGNYTVTAKTSGKDFDGAVKGNPVSVKH